MEEQNKFFVFDSYVFALKNALANARIFTLSYLIWLGALILSAIILVLIPRTVGLFPVTIEDWRHLIINTPFSIKAVGILFLMLLLSWFTAGSIRIALRIHDTGGAHVRDLFPSPWLIIKTYLGLILFMTAWMLCFILLIVPGIYFAVRAWFYWYALVDGEGIFEAFSTSFRITRSKGWQIFSLFLLSSAFTKITLFFGIPIVLLSSSYAYRLLKKNT